MSNRKATDQHARDRAEERYGTKWEDRDCAEVLALIRKCQWVPFELQGTRIRALLKYKGEFYHIVFETADLSLVTNLPPSEERLTPEQFERARRTFPELASYAPSSPTPPQAPSPAALPAAKAPVERSFFDSVVLPRFGRDKKKALLWWETPNHELGANSPAELEAEGKVARLESFMERTKREHHALAIPQRRAAAKSECKECRGYPPPGMICRCEEP